MRSSLLRRGWSAAASLVAVAVLGAAVIAADPVAVVVKVAGQVSVQRVAGGSAPAAVGMRLEPGDKLLPSAGGQAVLLFRTGRKVTATAAMQIEAVKEVEQSGLFNRSVGTLTRVASTDAAQNPNRQGMIRPIAGSAVPIAPRNQITLRGDHPTFAWFALPGAGEYVIQVRRVDGPCAPGVAERPQTCKPSRFSAGADTTWTLPAGEPGLAPGGIYAWTVAPAKGGRPAPEQRFRIVAAEEEARLKAATADLVAAGLDPETDGLFLTALAYRDAGLYYDARRALDKLAATGAGLGVDYHQLRGEVLDHLGELQAAAVEFAAARQQ